MQITNKATCPGSGLAGLNTRNNPDTIAMIGDCPSCNLSYAVKRDNGIFKHLLHEPQLDLDYVAEPEPRLTNTDFHIQDVWVSRMTAVQTLQGKRIAYLEKRLDRLGERKRWWRR
tara:strand:- start:158 stop:502 length:345 start_codon:yes stop_codon:yes gene_type:complete